MHSSLNKPITIQDYGSVYLIIVSTSSLKRGEYPAAVASNACNCICGGSVVAVAIVAVAVAVAATSVVAAVVAAVAVVAAGGRPGSEAAAEGRVEAGRGGAGGGGRSRAGWCGRTVNRFGPDGPPPAADQPTPAAAGIVDNDDDGDGVDEIKSRLKVARRPRWKWSGRQVEVEWTTGGVEGRSLPPD